MISHEAQVLWMLFSLGVVSSDEVIDWADGWIAKEERPKDELFTISGATRDRYALTKALSELGRGADYWNAFREVCGKLEAFIRKNPEHAEACADLLYSWLCERLADHPKDLDPLFRFSDAFALARDGTYGDTESEKQQFLATLLEVKEGANQAIQPTPVRCPPCNQSRRPGVG
jgi:hypothetical protein